MGNRFASGKYAIAQCDRCDQRFKLSLLRREVIKTKNYELLVCPECWDPDQPQLQLGMYPVDDPQGLRNPALTAAIVCPARVVCRFNPEMARWEQGL